MITGTEDRQHAYVALTRGTDTNMAYVFTLSPDSEPPVGGKTDGTGDPLAVLSALQTQQQALSNADHLSILHAIWAAETTPMREQGYKKLLMDALPPGYRQEPSHQVSGDPAVYAPPSGSQHIYIRGTNNNLLEFIPDHLGGRIWNSYDQTASTGHQVTGDPAIYTLSSGAQHIYIRSSS